MGVPGLLYAPARSKDCPTGLSAARWRRLREGLAPCAGSASCSCGASRLSPQGARIFHGTPHSPQRARTFARKPRAHEKNIRRKKENGFPGPEEGGLAPCSLRGREKKREKGGNAGVCSKAKDIAKGRQRILCQPLFSHFFRNNQFYWKFHFDINGHVEPAAEHV